MAEINKYNCFCLNPDTNQHKDIVDPLKNKHAQAFKDEYNILFKKRLFHLNVLPSFAGMFRAKCLERHFSLSVRSIHLGSKFGIHFEGAAVKV